MPLLNVFDVPSLLLVLTGAVGLDTSTVDLKIEN